MVREEKLAYLGKKIAELYKKSESLLLTINRTSCSNDSHKGTITNN